MSTATISRCKSDSEPTPHYEPARRKVRRFRGKAIALCLRRVLLGLLQVFVVVSFLPVIVLSFVAKEMHESSPGVGGGR